MNKKKKKKLLIRRLEHRGNFLADMFIFDGKVYQQNKCVVINYQPFIEELGWKIVDELITLEYKMIVFKFLIELAPKYLCDLSGPISAMTAKEGGEKPSFFDDKTIDNNSNNNSCRNIRSIAALYD